MLQILYMMELYHIQVQVSDYRYLLNLHAYAFKFSNKVLPTRSK